jgi:putative DNA primase/helicase
MFILVGDGSNGKSLLQEIISKLMGAYGASSGVEILIDKRTPTAGNLGEIARLNKVRCVLTEEPKLGDKLNESAVKTMTSGIGKIVARFLYGNEFEFYFKAKILMGANYKPVIRGTDHGIWRRIKTIPFNVVIPDERQDKYLIEKLSKELPEILGWAVEGCLRWQKEGLNAPKIILDSIKEYKSEMDVVQRWADEACEYEPGYREKSTDLFNNFCNYINVNREFQISHTMFGRNLNKKFVKKMYGGAIYYIGIRLKEDNAYRIDRRKYDEI